MSTTPTVTSIVPMSTPMEVAYIYLFVDADGTEEFEQHRDPILGMAMLDRDPRDGQLDFVVLHDEWRCPVTLTEFSDEGVNRYVIGVYPQGVEPPDYSLGEAQGLLRDQVKRQRAEIARRAAEHEAKSEQGAA